MKFYKLKGDIERYTCNLLAQDKSFKEVQNLLKENQNISVSDVTIRNFAKEKCDEIETIKNSLLAKRAVSEIPIANERVRLEREECLYQLSQGLKSNLNKIDFGLKCLREARDETKGSGSYTSNIQFNQFNQLTDAQLLLKKAELEKKIIELSRNKEGEYAVK